jgi:hypothetical protein
MEQADFRDMFRKASKSVCKSTVVVPPHNLSPTPLTSAAMKNRKNTEEDPEPADGDIQMEYSCD